LQSISCALWFLAGLVSSYRHHIETVPAAESNFASIAQYISSHNGLDAPHVTPINASAYDWWYFDVVSEYLGYSVVVVFFNAPMTAFPFSGARQLTTSQKPIFSYLYLEIHPLLRKTLLLRKLWSTMQATAQAACGPAPDSALKVSLI
jgi:hypothetical protein